MSDTHTENLAAALKAKKKLAKLSAKHTESVEKLKTKYTEATKTLLAGLSPEVAALVDGKWQCQ